MTSDAACKRYFDVIKQFQRASGSKVNYRKSNGIYLGKWKNRSDHPFGISWVPYSKLLGYLYGTGFNDDGVWSKLFGKFTKTLNFFKIGNLSLKGKSVVLNTFCMSKLYYCMSAGSMPRHYIDMFQRASFKFLWNSCFEPVKRMTLHLSYKKGGLNVPNLMLKMKSFQLSHIQKLLNNHDAMWTYFAKYWLGIRLRKYNASLFSNTVPHGDTIPDYYKKCMSTFDELIQSYPNLQFGTVSTRAFYDLLFKPEEITVKTLKLFPSIDFKVVFANLNSSCISPRARDLCWKMAHDVVYVNYFLKFRHISKTDKCPLCNGIETVSHLFLECRFASLLNKHILRLFNRNASPRLLLSEVVFRFLKFSYPNDVKHKLLLILLSESRLAIWQIRNLALHEKKVLTPLSLKDRFNNMLKLRILTDFERLNAVAFSELWCDNDFCEINDISNTLEFNDILQ